MCLFVQMGVAIKMLNVTGQFDTVTGQSSLSLTLYHKEKSEEPPLQVAPPKI